ncbi:MAG: hypothetical protein IJ194_06640 [Bacilli bacterium]|nr:hypothetical protein [Bacilli bacterium]
MTEEEYQRYMEEQRQLLAQIDSLEDTLNRKVDYCNQLVEELNRSLSEMSVAVQNSYTLKNYMVPVLGALETRTEESFMNADTVYSAIVDLEKKYFLIKNVATASKNLTNLNDQYQRKFRFFEKLRKVTLGYVIGVDSEIISNETLREEVEKEQLLNADYWLSYALSGLMLWVNDEKEASQRAVAKAIELADFKTYIFYMLTNLRFGRKDAAKQWYRLYQSQVDIYDLGEEFQFVLEAYLHHAFGQDKEFEKEVGAQFNQMLQEIRTTTASFDNQVKNNVDRFALSYPHSTQKTYDAIQENSKQYEALLRIMSMAEAEGKINEYYREILNGKVEEIAALSLQIENVLHHLVSAYDPEEYEIIKEQKRNEYIVKAHGDMDQAHKRYMLLVEEMSKKLTLGDLLFRFAFADIKEKMDSKLRLFAIAFMLEPIKEGYKIYHQRILENRDKKFDYSIDGCKLSLNADSTQEGAQTLSKYYDKNRRRMRLKDGAYKTLGILFILSFVVTALLTTLIITVAPKEEGQVALGWWIALISVAVLTVLFFLLSLFRRSKLNKKISKRKQDALERFAHLMESIKKWRDDLDTELKNQEILQETLDLFQRKGE